MPDNLQKVKVGDELIVSVSDGFYRVPVVARAERVTATQIIIIHRGVEYRFKKSDGYEVGSSTDRRRERIEIPTPARKAEVLLEIKRRAARRKVEDTDWSAVTDEQCETLLRMGLPRKADR